MAVIVLFSYPHSCQCESVLRGGVESQLASGLALTNKVRTAPVLRLTALHRLSLLRTALSPQNWLGSSVLWLSHWDTVLPAR